MSKLDFLYNAPKKEAVNTSEQIQAYDSGQTEIIESPEVDVRRMPNQMTRPFSESLDPGEDEKYGFVEQDIFDPIDRMEGYQSPLGYDPTEDRTTNNFNILAT